MAHFTTTFDTPASAEATFAFLADFSNVEAWDPSVQRARRLDDPPIREGSRFEVVLSLAGREIPFEYRITRHDPARRVVLEAENEWLRSLDTIDVDPRPRGARVHYDADLRPQGLAYLFDLPLHLAFQIAGARSARGLERALERLAHGQDTLGPGSADPAASPRKAAGERVDA